MIREALDSVTVCLPTYNERENLERMVHALAPHGVRVLVIDDNSPDGTGEIADRLAAELDFVDVLHRPREGGPGPRVHRRVPTRARRAAPRLIMEMDCDFSHDPADVPRLIAAVRPAPISRSARATSRAAASRTGGAAGGSSRRAARSTRG